MKLSNTAITTFQEKYLQMYGIHLSDEEANAKGLDMLRYMQVIYKPIPKEK